MAERSEFELFAGARLGRYTHGKSALHTLDPRVKVLLGALLIGASVGSAGVLSQFVLLAAIVLGFTAARLDPMRGFKPVVPVLPFVLVLVFIQVFAVPQLREGATVLWERGVLKVSDRSLRAGLVLLLRFAVIVSGMSLLASVTQVSDMTAGIEHLLRPLQKLGFPAHELALAVGISIRFLPVLSDETARLMKAQASRGADFGYRRGNFIRKMRKMIPLLVPLFLVSLRRAQNLIEAMESRCYNGGKGRTYLRSPRIKSIDLAVLGAAFLVAAGAVALSAAGVDISIGGWSS